MEHPNKHFIPSFFVRALEICSEKKQIWKIKLSRWTDYFTTFYWKTQRSKDKHTLEKTKTPEMSLFSGWRICYYIPRYVNPKPSLKIRTPSAIFWDYLGMFRDYGHFFLGIKLFLFFKIEKWNFQVPFEIKFREASQISTQSDNR